VFKHEPPDHFYTIDRAEILDKSKSGLTEYTEERPVGYIFPTRQPSTLPLYRLYNSAKVDHFYTTSEKERDAAVKRDGYKMEGTAGYIYPRSGCGGVPLYRMFICGDNWDHFYTTNVEEKDNAIAPGGYRDEGIVGYIFPY
jgi:hypothetical protein